MSLEIKTGVGISLIAWFILVLVINNLVSEEDKGQTIVGFWSIILSIAIFLIIT